MTNVKKIFNIFVLTLIVSQTHATKFDNSKNKVRGFFKKNAKIEPKKESTKKVFMK